MSTRKRAAVEAREVALSHLDAFRAEVELREKRQHLSTLQSLVQTAGMPKVWMRVLRVIAEVVGEAAPALVAATYADSPGGRKVTKEELTAIAERAAAKLKAGLLEEFSGEVE